MKMLLVDDQPIILRGLENLLANEQEVDVIGTAQDGKKALTFVESHQPDLMILDIRMPLGMGGIETCRQVHLLPSPPKILIFSNHMNFWDITELMQTGIEGFIRKGLDFQPFISSIRRISAGGFVFQSTILEKLHKAYLESGELPPPDTEKDPQLGAFLKSCILEHQPILSSPPKEYLPPDLQPLQERYHTDIPSQLLLKAVQQGWYFPPEKAAPPN